MRSKHFSTKSNLDFLSYSFILESVIIVYKLIQTDGTVEGSPSLEKVLECLLGLSKLECRIFQCLLAYPDGECCQELARQELKDRTVIQKTMKRLLGLGLIERKPVLVASSDRNLYKFVYTPASSAALRDLLLSMIEEARLRMIEVVDESFPDVE